MTTNRIALLRRAAKLERAEVAAKLGVTERTMYRWEAGEVQIPDEQKLALADLLGVSVTHMLGWDSPVEDDDENGDPEAGVA